MPIAIIEVIAITFIIAVVSFLQKDIHISKFFVNSSALLITFGGTFAASLIHFSTKEILAAIRYLKQVFFKDPVYQDSMVNTVIELSNLFRENGREGLKVVKREISHPLLLTGIDLLSAELEEDEFSEYLKISIKSFYGNLKKYECIFADMAVYAPLFGLLGTLIGLIQLLRELAEPKTIAPNMAIALVTTFYGLLLAGLVFMPISGKIKIKSDIELKNSKIIYDGLVMIKKGLGPLSIEQKLRAYL